MSLGIDGSLGTTSLGLGDTQPRAEYGFTLFPLTLDWSQSYREVLNWMTTIHTALDGTEQAKSGRLYPRKVVSSLFAGRLDLSVTLDAIVSGLSDTEFAMPNWTESSAITADTTASTQIFLDTSMVDFKENDSIVIYESPTKYEFARIVTLNAGNIIVPDVPFYEWKAGTKVYTLSFVKALLPSSFEYLTSTVARINQAFEVNLLSSNLNLPTLAPAVTYEGMEVFDDETNWRDGVSVTIEKPYMDIDSGYGLTGRFYHKNAPYIVPHRFWLKSASDKREFRAFLQRRRGQLNPFWYVLRTEAGEVVSAVDTLSDAVSFSGSAIAVYGSVNTGKKAMAFHLRSGAIIYKTVDTIEIESGNSRVVFTTAIGTSFAPSDVVKVSWMLKCRLASDQVTIDWLTDSFAEPELYFRSVR